MSNDSENSTTEPKPFTLQQLREAAGLSISELARAMGLSYHFVWRIEKGERGLSLTNGYKWLSICLEELDKDTSFQQWDRVPSLLDIAENEFHKAEKWQLAFASRLLLEQVKSKAWRKFHREVLENGLTERLFVLFSVVLDGRPPSENTDNTNTSLN